MVWTITSSARVEQNCGKHLKGNLLKLSGERRVTSGETEEIPGAIRGEPQNTRDPETWNRKPALREIVMREQWSRGSRDVDRKEDGLGKFYD